MVGTFLLSKMSLNVIIVKLFLKNVFGRNPPWRISILADFRLMGYKLSCCGSLWSR